MDPVETTRILQTYGPWAIVVLETILSSGIIISLWRAMRADRRRFDKELAEERARRDADAQGFHLAQIQNVRDAAERESRFADVLRMFAPKG